MLNNPFFHKRFKKILANFITLQNCFFYCNWHDSLHDDIEEFTFLHNKGIISFENIFQLLHVLLLTVNHRV